MRRAVSLLPLLPWLSFAACCPAPPPRASSAAAGNDAFVLRQWTRAVPAPEATRCVVVDTASQWREERKHLGPLAAALADDWCHFAIERAVVVVVAGPFAAAVTPSWHSEEGVDVLTLTPAPAATATAGGIVHVLAVPASTAQLAIVLRAPGPDGLLVESTLAVFAGR